MKRALLSIFVVLAIVTAGCGKEYAELNTVRDLSLFGSTPEEAETLLGISLDGIEPETEDENIPNADVYRMPDKYLIGGYPADVELGFYRSTTPEGTPIGLSVIAMYFESDIDMKKLAEEIGAAYEFDTKFSYGTDEKNNVDSFSWTSAPAREYVGQPLDEVVGQTTDLIGVTANSPYFSIDGYRSGNDYVLVYVVGTLGAVIDHIEDYNL